MNGRLHHAACLVMALSAAACGGSTGEDAPLSGPAVPPGAIKVTSELYMLPMGVDEDGCALFQPWSPTLSVVQALHWRTADGGFTLDRAAADCAGDDAPPATGRPAHGGP